MKRMELIKITSPRNASFKMWRKLQQSRKERHRRRKLLIEGENLLAEARKSHCPFHAVLCRETHAIPDHWRLWLRKQRLPVYALRSALYDALMDTESPQGIAAVIRMPPPLPFDMDSRRSFVLLLDRIQDPGNLGTILRTALAAGVSFVGLGPGTVDPFNPKAVRSAAGAIFRIPFQSVNLPEWMRRYQKAGGTVVGTKADAEDVYYDVRYPDRIAFLLGNEGQGVAPRLLEATDRKVRIPQPGGAESLNVAAAAAIVLYEAVRQRS